MPVNFLPAPAAVAAMAPQADNSKLAQLYAQLLLKGSTSTAPIQSHWEGVNKLVQGALAGMAMGREAAQNRAAIEGMEALAFPGMSMPKTEQPGLLGGLGEFGKNIGAIFGGSESKPASSTATPSTTTLAKALSGDPMGQPSWRDDAMVKFDNPLAAAVAGVKPGTASVAPVTAAPSAAPPAQVRPSAFDAPAGSIPTAPPVSDMPFGADSVTAQTLRPPANIPQASGVSPVEVAATKLGMSEAVPALRDFLYNGGKNLDPQTRAWCADFVNATLRQAGLPGTGSGMARSFLNYGEEVKEPKRGDIAVFSRGNPQGPSGHVGFFDRYADDGSIRVLGGNQGDAVSYANYPANRLLGFRRPPSAPPSPFNAPPGAVATTGEPAAQIPPGIPPMQGQAVQTALAVPGLNGAGGPPMPTPQRMASPAPSVSPQQPFQVASLGGGPVPQAEAPVPAAPPPPRPAPVQGPSQPATPPAQFAQAPQSAPQAQQPAIMQQYQRQLDQIGQMYQQAKASRNTKLQEKLINAAIGIRGKMMEAEASRVRPVRGPNGEILWQETGKGEAKEHPGAKSTDDIREYEFAKRQGYQGSFEQFKRDMRQAGATRIDARQMGTVPPGYRAEYDEQGRVMQLVPIPGGPAEATIKKDAAAETAKKDQAKRYADVVTEDVDRAIELVEKAQIPVTGVGSFLSGIPGTQARNVASLLETIKANIGFDRLQQMRQASPTGGALGAVSEFENKLLQSTIGSLEQSQSQEQFLYNLRRVKDLYLDIIHGPGNRPQAQNVWQGQQGGLTPDQPQMFGVPGAPQPQASPQSQGDWTTLPNGVRIRQVR